MNEDIATVTDEERVASISFDCHQDGKHGFRFMYPEDWHCLAYSDGRAGVLYAPTPDAWPTGFGVEVKDLGVEVSKDDVADLEAGFRQGIESLPSAQVAWLVQRQTEPVIVLEAAYTFREGGSTRQRRAQLLYYGGRQFHVFAQGKTPEAFECWRPQLYTMLMTFCVLHGHPGQSA